MSDIRISQEEYKTLLIENAELKYLTATQKVEIERMEKDLIKYEEEIESLEKDLIKYEGDRFGE